jgi:hypothetical protein
MPIIQTSPPDAPLTQGDILSGVVLFATKGSWEDKGRQAAVARSDLCRRIIQLPSRDPLSRLTPGR